MDPQDAGVSSLPVSLTMEILSIWDEALESLSRKVSKRDEQYLAGEFALVALILQQITKASQEHCLSVLKNTPFFQKAYKNILDYDEMERNFITAFHTALASTRQTLDRARVEILPFTFLGSFFERFGIFGKNEKKISARNATGSFFTPAAIARFIITKTIEIGNFTNSIEKICCLDPACGGGIFLVALAETLLRRILDESANKANAKVDCIRTILTRQIWGIDLSSNAQRVSQLQLALWAYSLVPNVDLGEICSWVNHCTQGNFLEIPRDGLSDFSVIVGNPPFGNLLSAAQKAAAKGWATTRTREISELFLERALGILDAGGCLGFVMPKTMAYYAQWARARALILPAKIAGVADLGLSFPGVNFETLALFVKNAPGVEKGEPFPIFGVDLGKIGNFPRRYISETGLMPLQPLAPDEETVLEAIRNNSVPVSRLVQTNQVIRGIYVPEEEKAGCKAGSLLWINRVPDIQHYAIKSLWKVDPGVISLANPSRLKALQCPKVLLKVLRGRKLCGIPDPCGILVPTEKLVSIRLDKCSPREILAWSACLNSWPASYYLQKVIFSGTTESARVLDYAYLKHVPVLLHKSQAINAISGVHLALLLASQIQAQLPSILSPNTIPELGVLFQQVAFHTYSGEVPSDSQLSLEDDFDTYLQLWREFVIRGAKKSPAGGLSRDNLTNFNKNQESTKEMNRGLERSAQDFARQLKKLLFGSITLQNISRLKKATQWQMLGEYFNSRF